MGRIIVGTGLAGIAGLTALDWWLTYRRLSDGCPYGYAFCIRGAERAPLDHILLTGLAVALAFIVASLTVLAIVKARRGDRPVSSKSGWSPANQEQQTRLR